MPEGRYQLRCRPRTIERWITPDIAWEALPPFTMLGIDEIALKKGYRDYVVIITHACQQGASSS